MENAYSKAYSEVYQILQLMPESLVNKIPTKFCKFIDEERDKDYELHIQEPIEDYDLKQETIIILGLIYRDFLCSEEDRKMLQVEDSEKLAQAQKRIEEATNYKYNIDVFKEKNDKKLNKNDNQQQENNTEKDELHLTELENKWYKKIFKIIKKLFSKNRR